MKPLRLIALVASSLFLIIACNNQKWNLPAQYLLAEEVLDAEVKDMNLNGKAGRKYEVLLILKDDAVKRIAEYEYDTEIVCINGDFRITMVNQSPASSQLLHPYEFYLGSIITDRDYLQEVMRAIGKEHYEITPTDTSRP